MLVWLYPLSTVYHSKLSTPQPVRDTQGGGGEGAGGGQVQEEKAHSLLLTQLDSQARKVPGTHLPCFYKGSWEWLHEVLGSFGDSSSLLPQISQRQKWWQASPFFLHLLPAWLPLFPLVAWELQLHLTPIPCQGLSCSLNCICHIPLF